MKQLRNARARLETQAKVKEITDKGLIIEKADFSTDYIEADTVVITNALQPDTSVADTFAGRKYTVYAIGDCAEPGRLLEATAAGFIVGQKI
jgi:hypothetical protein